MKNKPLEDILGYEKAKLRKDIYEQKVYNKRRNHTYEEYYGVEKAKKVKYNMSICNSCNSKVNKNRKYWENYFSPNK